MITKYKKCISISSLIKQNLSTKSIGTYFYLFKYSVKRQVVLIANFTVGIWDSPFLDLNQEIINEFNTCDLN